MLIDHTKINFGHTKTVRCQHYIPNILYIFSAVSSLEKQILVLTNAQAMMPTAQESESIRANMGHDGCIISNADMSKCDSLFNITSAKPGDFRNFRKGTW